MNQEKEDYSDYVLTYAGTKKEAQKLGAFYTPPSLGKKMVDKVTQSLVGKTCLDNCCGYGNLVLMMLDKKLEQGEDPTQALSEVYGNEFDRKNLEVCIRNLRVWADKHGAKWDEDMIRSHFHQGDALKDEAYDFPDKKWGLDIHAELEKTEDEAVFKVIKLSKIIKEAKFKIAEDREKIKDLVVNLKKKNIPILKV